MWDWAIWGALVVGGSAAIGSAAFLLKRGLAAWRGANDVRARVVASLAEFSAKAEQTADRIEAAADTTELQESVSRLRVSLARLAVLRAALGDVEETAGRVTVFVPRA